MGKADPSRDHENIPRQLNVTIRTNEQCFLKNNRFALISSENTFCAAGKDGKSGPCHGDSGSGLFIRSQTSKRWFLKGIVSASFITNGMCDVSEDAIYTNVIKYLSWIEDETKASRIQLPAPIIDEPEISPRASKEVFCFFEGWAEGREGNGAFFLNDLRPELCTTAVYLLANLEGDN